LRSGSFHPDPVPALGKTVGDPDLIYRFGPGFFIPVPDFGKNRVVPGRTGDGLPYAASPFIMKSVNHSCR